MAKVIETDGSGSSSPSKKGVAGNQSPREAAQKIQDYDNNHSGNRGVAGDQSPREAAQKIQDYDNSNSRSNSGGNSGGNGGSSNGGSSSGGSSKGGSSSGSSKSSAKAEIKAASIPGPSVGSGVTSVAVASSALASSAVSVSAPKLTKVATTNLTAQNLKNWKARVDRTLSRDLLTSLKISYENALQLDKATASADGAGDLNLIFKELTKAMDGAVRQLATFVKALDTDLNTYISTLEKAEKTTSDKMKTSVKSFTDAANKINKLK